MSVRTTVTLDEDVLESLKLESRKRGIPFRQTLNEVLRAGLAGAPPLAPRRLQINAQKMGQRPGLNYDSVAALLEIGEGEAHR